MDPVFNDRVQFPYLYRTVPNEHLQYPAIIQLLQQFGWTWVGILTSDDDSSQRGSQELKDMIIRNDFCVAFLLLLSSDDNFVIDDLIQRVAKSSAKVVIISSKTKFFDTFIGLYSAMDQPEKIWISTAAMSHFTSSEMNPKTGELLNGSLSISIHKGEIPGLKEFLYSASPYVSPDDEFIRNVWKDLFACVFNHDFENDTIIIRIKYCYRKENLQSVPQYLYDVHNFRFTYSIYIATYAVAYALNDMLSDKLYYGNNPDRGTQETKLQPWKLNHYLKKVYFTSSSKEEVYFNNGGEIPGQYDIINWVTKLNTLTDLGNATYKEYNANGFIVGSYNASAPLGNQLIVNDSDILWNPKFDEIPVSVCTKSCAPGYRKASRAEHPICCYDCSPCSEGEISNTIDAETCEQCPEDQWPNDKRTVCILRTLEFISYESQLGITLLSVSLIFFISTTAVLVLFMKHHKTPLVKANNKSISYTLLVSLMLSFLCSLLFIGRPMKVTCLLRQAAFGIIFTVSVSCVLAKSVTVVIAFNATKPGSKIKKWVGFRVSSSLVIICSLVQVVICTVWLILYPPYPDHDTQSNIGKMILKCNEGSVTAFYIVIGYMGFLSVLSFIVAFLVRNLPASFNESQMITFSMLVFCCVWVTFIPAYLNTKGKYMVAVEIFAILASSAGLVGCIFIPKCYIILFKQHMNTREHIIGKNST
ncbi:vomeronasal type-2 receptor 26-like [Discoglossus pictus]